ncbi:MAG: M28 family peptidase [Acidimicrobiales bacterium]
MMAAGVRSSAAPTDGAVAFFDIGNTLASVALSADGERIERLTAYGHVPPVLAALKERGVSIGIISDRGAITEDDVNVALAGAGLDASLTPELVLYGSKDSPRIFEEAARQAVQAGLAGPLLFVGEDAAERAQALLVDFVVAPHPRLALPVLEQPAPLRYVRITVPPAQATTNWRAVVGALAVLPLHVTGPNQSTVYAIATTSAAAQLDDLGFWVDRLGREDEPLATDLYVLRDDHQQSSGFLLAEGNASGFFESGPAAARILTSTEAGLFVAIPAGRSVESYHFRDAQHGHNLKLVPSLSLLDGFGDDGAPMFSRPASESLTGETTLSAAERKTLRAKVKAQQVTKYVQRYAGARPLVKAGPVIRSRHVHHPHNILAVDALARDLETIGGGRFVVRRHQFTHEGKPLQNVEAELPGSGLDGVVLVTAHLDSTATRQAGYRPGQDPAPGADDDASGIAGVLTAASAIVALDTALAVPRRAVRFVLFNAEEHGLVGSRAYARDEAARQAPIHAVLQMDMIGHDVVPGPVFELHGGFSPSTEVQARSLNLVRTVAAMRAQVAPRLRVPQIYPAGSEHDPAEERSDHFSFQSQGYAACVACEDIFPGPGSAPGTPDANPNYHHPGDTDINASYAADIARMMAAAAWILATR